METKEIKIDVPEGYIIDKENSMLECIKFKKKYERWIGNKENAIDEFYIDDFSSSFEYRTCIKKIEAINNIFATEKQT